MNWTSKYSRPNSTDIISQTQCTMNKNYKNKTYLKKKIKKIQVDARKFMFMQDDARKFKLMEENSC